MEDEYIYLSKGDADKLLPIYQEMENFAFTDAMAGVMYAIHQILVIPAKPSIKNEICEMIIERKPIPSINAKISSYKDEQEYTLIMISQEYMKVNPRVRIDHLQLVVDGGEMAYGFGIVVQPPHNLS